MDTSVYDMKAFYNGKVGRVVRRLMRDRIREIWPDVTGLHLMGCGYAVPYLRSFKSEAKQITAMMSAGQGALHWPHDGQNCVFLSHGSELPIETNSVDRILMIHDLEFSDTLQTDLQEVWRVLKSSGRVLVIVPNRSGLWARAEWSPFGRGTPYSASQICRALREHQFVQERAEEALFVPPVQYSPFLKVAGFFENIGANYLPIAAGVHMIEASKQLYAKANPGAGTPAYVRGRLFPKPTTSTRKSAS